MYVSHNANSKLCKSLNRFRSGLIRAEDNKRGLNDLPG